MACPKQTAVEDDIEKRLRIVSSQTIHDLPIEGELISIKGSHKTSLPDSLAGIQFNELNTLPCFCFWHAFGCRTSWRFKKLLGLRTPSSITRIHVVAVRENKMSNRNA